MNSLATVWPYVQRMLDDGISIIPVRDKEELYNGTLYGPKTPCLRDWKQYQSTRPTKEELWYNTERANTTAFALICGRVSGNLFIIDIDVKYKEGCDAVLFMDLKTIYPVLFDRLRIHRTPSGGYHIIYRIAGDKVPGNEKLASRNPTTDELTTDPKNKKPKAFIETRGEGGYAVAPPSLGYTVHQDRPIPNITWEEHCSIINLCRSYNEVMKVEKAPTSTKHDSSYYSENPWDDFNASSNAHQVLSDHGWSFKSESNKFIWFTRPGKDQGVSASWNKEKKVFYIFTSSTDFDPSTGYLPSTALAILKFGGDKKQTYRWLVDNGFGKVRPEVEQRLIQSKATKGGTLPANASKAAQEALAAEVTRITETYPHGIFWFADEESYKINRERLYVVSEGLGFRTYQDQVVRIVDHLVIKQTDREYFDTLKGYIQEEDYDTYEAIANAYEAFIQRSGKFTISRLLILDTSLLLACTKSISYKFFTNGYVQVTGEEIELHPYTQLAGKLIWADQILQREIAIQPVAPTSLYYQFLNLAIGITDHLKQCIGYLSHDFKDEEMGYIVTLIEQCTDPKAGGGSGKNVFSSMLGLTTTLKTIPGAQTKYDEKFLNAWNFERILSLSDVPKKFDFAFLKELSTGSGILKKLFKDEVSVLPSQMPKFLVSTNFSYEISDGGLRRRIIPIEFTDFFTKSGGVNAYFNAMFPSDWVLEEWSAFDNFILQSIQAYLQANGKLAAPELTNTGWLKQYDHTFGQLTRLFIEEHWEQWVSVINVPIEAFNNQYTTYCNTNQIAQPYRLSSVLMNRALVDWSKRHKVDYDPNFQRKENGTNEKCKRFLSQQPF